MLAALLNSGLQGDGIFIPRPKREVATFQAFGQSRAIAKVAAHGVLSFKVSTTAHSVFSVVMNIGVGPIQQRALAEDENWLLGQ